MITRIGIENFYAFSEKCELTFYANMQTKRFIDNVRLSKDINVIKTLALYGPNNVGKTCFITAFKVIKAILENKHFNIMPNIFQRDNKNKKVSKLEISFMHIDEEYTFETWYDCSSNSFVFEKFSKTLFDEYKNRKEEILLLKDTIKKKYKSKNADLTKFIEFTANNNILIYLLDDSKFSDLKDIKDIIQKASSMIEVIDMNSLSPEKTINMLKNNDSAHEKIVNFIKNADLYMDDFKYSDEVLSRINAVNSKKDEKTESIELPKDFQEELKLVSVYRGVAVPSVLFDSMGTKKIAALASYIVDALENGKVLIVDELDSSLHYKITRALVSMFNNEMNKDAQLIFTVHDVNLLDLKKLLRKEQIAFMNKDEKGVCLYNLDCFSAQDGIRETTDLIERYKKGFLGAVPNPNMFKALLNIVDDKK